MKITIEGNGKKIKQLIRELKPRVKLDKIKMTEQKEVKNKTKKKTITKIK